MGHIVVRTDLAVEANEEAVGCGRLKGVRFRENRKSRTGVKVTQLQITNRLGEAALGRPRGTYITIEAEKLACGNEDYAREVISTLTGYIFKLIRKMNKGLNPERVLFIGLGNRNITSDSLGPAVIDNIFVDAKGDGNAGICALTPGVMAQTGIETADIIKGVVECIKPDMCVAIDALAARSVTRLNSTIQLSDRGINPGSGVGNHRVGITRDNIGVPVLAIGVPTVIDAAGIVAGAGKMYVTPKDIDSDIRNIAKIISEAINRVGVHIHG